MQEYLEEANVLIEALPYIRKFSSKIILIEYGGSIMGSEGLKHCAIRGTALSELVGLKPIIVHGRGKDISKMCEELDVKSEFNNGLRVSGQATAEVASMVLSYINKSLVHNLQSLDVKAIGLCGKDRGFLERVQRDENLDFVSEIQKVNSSVSQDLLGKDSLPVIAPIGMGENFNIYNINADDAACAIAKALKTEKPTFLADTAGLYENFEDKDSSVSKISITQAKALVNKIQGGMHIKLKSRIDACESGVKKVYILDGRAKHSLLLEFFTDEGTGTLVG